MFHSLVSMSFWGYVAVTLIMTHITVLGVTIYLHRCQAHRALDLNPVLSHFFRLWLWLSTSMSTRAWVAIHRKHHTFVDTEDDPHSPVVLGLPRVFFGGVMLYRKESKVTETLERFGRGTPNDWLEKNLYSPRPLLGILSLLAIELVIFGWPALLIWAVQMIWIPLWAAGFINGVGHFWGYRNFASPDASTNIFPWGIIAGGEELHNNHHAFGTSAKLSVKWWEFDIGWTYIRLFEMLGLAKVHRSIPKIISDPKKNQVDNETLGALLGNRFQVLDQYWRKVVRPVLREQKQQATKPQQGLLRGARRLLTKDVALINKVEQEQLQEILSQGPTLKTIYDLKLELQEVWHRTTANQMEMLERLQKWCQQAEATGIHALQDFVNLLKTYTLKQQPVRVSADHQ
jgi:stearoyl-CoA desaturase (delta-9 desaturase)